MRYNINFFSKYNLKITEEPLEKKKIKDKHQLNFERDMHQRVINKNNLPQAIQQLEKGIEKYPNSETLHNYLYLAYDQNDEPVKAERILNATLVKFPDYEFAKFSLAQRYVDNKKFEEADKILGVPRDIRNIIKDEYIHLSQFNTYYDVCINYALEKGDIDEAKALHRMLFDYDPNSKVVKNLSLKIQLYNFQNSPLFKYNEVKRIEWKPKNNLLNSEVEMPNFHHDHIYKFYEFDLESIDNELIKEIFELPSETLIPDLEAVVKDSITRFNIHLEDDQYSSLNHALYFLGALESEQSLPIVLEIIYQNEDFRDFWFGDFSNKFFEPALYLMAKNQPKVLFEAVKTSNYNPYLFICPLSVAIQIGLHNPDKQQEIVDLFKDLLQFFLDKGEENPDFIDASFIAFIFVEISKIKAKECLPLIKAFFEKDNWVDEMVMGDYVEIEKKTLKELELWDIEPIPENIYEFYDESYLKRKINYQATAEEKAKFEQMLNPTDKYDAFMQKMGLDLLGGSDYAGDDDFYEKPKLKSVQSTKPLKNTTPKVGRNEKCPCGSGSKYKNCCGK